MNEYFLGGTKRNVIRKVKKKRIESGLEFSENSPFKNAEVIRYPTLEEGFSKVKIKEG